jgi:uncharacterized protein YlbG (UPF0298 family)
MPSIRDKLEGHDFSDMNQVLQCAMTHKNHAKEVRTYGRFKETSSKDKLPVNYVRDESVSDDEDGVCVVEWVDSAKDQPLACSFLKPSPGRKDEMKYTFNVSKCDKLFDVLL